jgi:hypothetical protein
MFASTISSVNGFLSSSGAVAGVNKDDYDDYLAWLAAQGFTVDSELTPGSYICDDGAPMDYIFSSAWLNHITTYDDRGAYAIIGGVRIPISTN